MGDEKGRVMLGKKNNKTIKNSDKAVKALNGLEYKNIDVNLKCTHRALDS